MFDIRSRIISRRGAPSEILPPRSCGNQITVRCRDPRGQCQNAERPDGAIRLGEAARQRSTTRGARSESPCRQMVQSSRPRDGSSARPPGLSSEFGRQCGLRRAAEAVDFAKAARLRSTDQPDPVRSGEIRSNFWNAVYACPPRLTRGRGSMSLNVTDQLRQPGRTDQQS